MKQKIAVVFFIIGIVGFFISINGNRHTMAQEELDLLTLVSVMKSENIDINEWSLHAREKGLQFNTLEEVQEHVENLRSNYPAWDWTIKSSTDQWEATATKVTSGEFQENIHVLSTLTKSTPQTYIIYEVQGKKVNQETEQFLKQELNKTLSDIFRENATIFSCIKGQLNDKMISSVTISDYMDELLDSFHAKEVESLTETDFISTSAYSPLFADHIKTKDKDMNLQLGIRTQGLGAKTTLVVGTPIITIEY